MTRQREGSELVDEVRRLRAENHELRAQRRELRQRIRELEDARDGIADAIIADAVVSQEERV